MANARETILVVDDTNWTLVPLDPDVEGYSVMYLNALTNGMLEWSPVEVIERTSSLPSNYSAFDYDVYVRKTKASDDVELAITRL